MSEISQKDLDNLKKKVNVVLNQITVLEAKIKGTKSVSNYKQLLILGTIDGKETTQEIHGTRTGVKPYNNAANDLLKLRFLIIKDPKKSKVTGKVPFYINFDSILNRIFSENQRISSTLVIEKIYHWFEIQFNFDKNACDKIIRFLHVKKYIKLMRGDPIGYSGRFYTDEDRVNYYYIIMRGDRNAFNNRSI